MTLERQLWIAICALMLTSFVGSFLVSNFSARSYLEEQLQRKNIDNANSLAMALSREPDDPMLRELLLRAQYDTGHYAFIALEGPGGTLEIGSREPAADPQVPAWLVRWFPIEPAPGVAQLSSGWQPQGQVSLQSDAGFAYRALWQNARRLLGYFALAAFAASLLGTVVLRILTRPLEAVVGQARAMGERRFVTIPEPRTPEFRVLSRAMNDLSARVKEMLSEETARLARWHEEHLHDPLTGLLAREAFLDRLTTLLQREDASAQGSLVILRLLHLNELNRRYGRPVLDAILRHFGSYLKHEASLHDDTIAGRLNGSELVLAAPEDLDPATLATSLRSSLIASCLESGVEAPALAAAATAYSSRDEVASLLQRVDRALAAAEQREGGGLEIAAEDTPSSRTSQDEVIHWSRVLGSAIAEERFALLTYPVCDRNGQLLHLEAPSRMVCLDGSSVAAAEFMPWIARLGIMAELDLVVVRLALRRIAATGEPLGVNLSARILEQPDALHELIHQVESAPEAASRLWLEVPENGVYPRLRGFKRLCAALRPLGCRLGIEHAGPAVARMGDLYDVGLDYVKLDVSLIRGIDAKRGNQAFVRGFCTIAHAIGLRTIAEGIETEREWQRLVEIGIGGGTGRYLSQTMDDPDSAASKG